MKVRELSVELQDKAKKELNENPRRVLDGLNSIREWLKFQKHLNYKDDDQFLLSFLRGCKFSLETVKKKLDYYYTSRTLAPDFFTYRSPFSKPIQTILKNNITLFFSPTTFPTISYSALSNIEKNNLPVVETMKHSFMALDLLMNEDDAFIINGIIMILDYKDVSLKHILQYHIPTLKKFTLILLNAYPIRIKGVYLINAPSIMDTVYKMLEVVFTEKIKKRIHIYSNKNMHKLFDVVPQNFLPTEFGGKSGSLIELAEAWKKKLENYSDRFKEEEQYKSIEELRVGHAKTYSDVFGQEGSFRQMDFD